MARKLLIFTGLFALWLCLSQGRGFGDIKHDYPALVMGAICCAVVTLISGNLLFQDKSISVPQLLVQFWRFAAYVPWILKEIVVANLHVLRLALSPTGPRDVDPRIVCYTTFLKSDVARFVFANSITLTPGTITILVDGDDYYIHAISEKTEKGLYGEMEKRVGAIYGEFPPDEPATQS
ncbi:MAG: Na+/H+ antiporter subunit E [Verrucomicrobiota bacterium]